MVLGPALGFIREEQGSRRQLPLKISLLVRAGAETRPLSLLSVAALDQGQEEAGLGDPGFRNASLCSLRLWGQGLLPTYCIWAISDPHNL